MPDNEAFADILFPLRGVDLYASFAEQRKGTTPLGENVRSYDPQELRSRGGARPGLSKFVAEQVPSGDHLIQHLNFIVDPTPDALPEDGDPDDPDDTTEDPTDNPPNSDPDDPNDHRPRNRGRRVRKGGWGRQPNRNRQQRLSSTLAYIQGHALAFESPHLVGDFAEHTNNYSKPVTKGSLLLVAVGTTPNTPDLVPTVLDSHNPVHVTDTQGNVYVQAGTYAQNDAFSEFRVPTELSVWYTLAKASGSNGVRVSQAGVAGSVGSYMYISVLEYHGAKGTLTGFSKTEESYPEQITEFTTGEVDVIASTKGSVVIGFFFAVYNHLTHGTNFVKRVGMNIAEIRVDVEDRLPVGLPQTPKCNCDETLFAYVAIGVSFQAKEP